jgi:enoyl-CoA hydratase/carnithine racemase
MALVRYDVADRVATITLDQPETRNALSDELLDELIAGFEAARDDDAVRCVVLTSSHEKVFSSGGEPGGLRGRRAARAQARRDRPLPALFR